MKIDKTFQVCFLPQLAGAETKLPSTSESWAHLFRAAQTPLPIPLTIKGNSQAGPSWPPSNPKAALIQSFWECRLKGPGAPGPSPHGYLGVS